MTTEDQNKSFQFLKRGVTEELLEFLVVLHEKKHLGLTAKRLNLSVPKASRLLAQAREIFNDPLFLRHGNGLAPTYRASELAERSSHILESMRALTESEVFDPQKIQRVFRIACLDNALTMVMGPVVRDFFAAAPQIGLSFHTHTEQTLSSLRTGDLDFGIFPAVNLPDDFESMKLLSTRYVQVVRKGHPLEKFIDSDEIERKIEQFRRIQIVVHPDTDPIESGMPGPAKIPHAATQTAIWTEGWLGACYLVTQTDFVLTIPRKTFDFMSKFLPIICLNELESTPLLEPSLIWHRRNHYDPSFVWFRSWLKVHLCND